MHNIMDIKERGANDTMIQVNHEARATPIATRAMKVNSFTLYRWRKIK